MNISAHFRLWFVLTTLCTAALVGCGDKPQPTSVAAAPTAAPTSVPSIPLKFTDVTARAGIHFQHNNGASGLKWIPESVGAGAVFFDYNGDGLPDIFFVNGRNWTPAEVKEYEKTPWGPMEFAYHQKKGGPMRRDIPPPPPPRPGAGVLYRNNGDGSFTDVTRGSGLDTPMYGMGASSADYDNDGRPDLLVTAWPRSYLFHNVSGAGAPRFQEVSEQAGVHDPGWSTSAAWLDYDKDGRLDLFVCHYVKWSPGEDVFGTINGRVGPKSYVGPQQYHGELNRLFHNEGGGRFRDVSARSGIQGKPGEPLESKSLGVVLCDVNSDGWPDLFVANDMMRNYLLQNNRDGTFGEVATIMGVAYSSEGHRRAGMGVDMADIDLSGHDSLLIGNFDGQMLGLYQFQGGTFKDIAPESEVGRASARYLTFGLAFVDVDNDGLPDIFTANGHVQDDIAQNNSRGITYAEPPLLLRNEGGARFRDISAQSGEALKRPMVARGLAYADFDGDGDEDVLLTSNGGPPCLLRNDGGSKNNSIRLLLQGTKSNRSAIGARVEAQVQAPGGAPSGARTLQRVVRGSSSYCSQNELPLTLGLGQAAEASLAVRWPSGASTLLGTVKAGQSITVVEGQGIVKRQPLRRSPKPS